MHNESFNDKNSLAIWIENNFYYLLEGIRNGQVHFSISNGVIHFSTPRLNINYDLSTGVSKFNCITAD